MEMFRSFRAKAGLTLALAAVAVMAMVGSAFATIEFKPEKLTEPVESQLGTALPIVLGTLGIIIGISWAIRFLVSKLRSAK
jgi:hypothetical protein